MLINTSRGIVRTLILPSLFIFAPTLASAIPAYPGAQGGGAVSAGGRGGSVIMVTNLNDSGAGSLRACVSASGPRTCVFRVAGTIELQSLLYIGNPYLTVAGQTAPGGGIQLSGKNMAQNMVYIGNHDVVWRYMRVRKGLHVNGVDAAGNIGAWENSYNIVIDHNSSQWNQDEAMNASTSGTWPSNNITFSYNLVAEGLNYHSTGFLAAGDSAGAGDRMTDMDYHHNLSMNNSHRNPLLRNKSTRYVNNLHYNQQWLINQFGGGIQVDVIGNLYKKGPLYNTGNYPVSAHEIQVFLGSLTATGSPSVYLSGNKGWNQTDPAGDQWLLATRMYAENGTGSPENEPIPAAWRRTSPLASPPYPIVAEPVGTLEASTLPIVGASRRLDCNGNWVANRDSTDTRLINQYQTNTGITATIFKENEVGGYPVIASGTPCADADLDGMPDVWETAQGLNPNAANNNGDADGDGYTNLEEYLNGTGSGTPPPSEATPPTVSITAPASGATVSGTTVTVAANASDNVGVASVVFRVDGTVLYTDSASPYSMVWNTTTATNGSHTLSAVARDAAGNSSTSASVTVAVNNAIPPSCTQTALNVSAATSDGGFAYLIGKSFGTPADNSTNPTQSTLRFFENGVEMGPPHSPHADIRNLGQRRFSHWSTTTSTGESLRFAASDNTDPRTNGRSYAYCTPAASPLLAPRRLRLSLLSPGAFPVF